ncbi:MAG: LysM domain-containing protein [Litorimonas sp.]
MKQWLIIGAVGLASCATTGVVGDKRRVVTLDAPAPVQTSPVRYDGPEAVAACDTKRMRKAALDGNPNNDTASITVSREVRPGMRTLTDLDVNCREYFAAKLGGSPEPMEVRDPTPAPVQATHPVQSDPTPVMAHPVQPVLVETLSPAPMVQARARETRHYHTVRNGETLYRIGVEHCTSWKAIAAENGIRNERRIEPGDVLRLPAGSC